ncbi:dTDP-4-dehydrorhamnose reductase [Shewanella pneumatophori]|uniref:dTDP-4-dehydrorhamnose reductase n=1 Tax=Shewanella pneumatophori TaxID=314092 RepID=A0A9X2CID4_9GAMM|nr:dTDP-4-dehydrorhamnose reductase [Shewanella pneumatophori]
MRVLITGAGGQLAQALLSVVQVATDARLNTCNTSQQLLLDMLPEITECIEVDDNVKGFVKEQLNICCQESIQSAFDEFAPDVVINCAAYNAVDNAEQKPTQAIAINEQGPKLLALECKARNIKLVHISTDFVFDGALSTAYTEQDLPSPLSVYGQSKLNGERAVAEVLGSDAMIIRTSWLYSCWGTNFVTTMQRLLATKERLAIIDDQTGSPTWCEALAVVIFKLIKQKADSEVSAASKMPAPARRNDVASHLLNNAELYHYAAAESCTWFELTKQIQKLMCAIHSSHRASLTCELEPITSEIWQSWHQARLATRPVQSALCAAKINSQLMVSEHSMLTAPWPQQLQAMLKYQALLNL